MKIIHCIINKKTGKITISTEGYQGAECLEATRKLEEGLGLKGEPEYTSEYYNTTEQQQELGGA